MSMRKSASKMLGKLHISCRSDQMMKAIRPGGPGSRTGKKSERNELEARETNVDIETDSIKRKKMGRL